LHEFALRTLYNAWSFFFTRLYHRHGKEKMRTWGLALVLSVGSLLTSVATAAPLIYTGHAISFTKTPASDYTLPANQDRILSDVIITRGGTRGIYNIAEEESYADNSSPAGTAWAFTHNNPSVTVAAANWAALNFTDWQSALGGGGSLGTAILEGDAVLHLVDQDIYLDIRFTSWGVGPGAGGGFSYERAAITPSADFDRDGDVDGQDFLTWQRNIGAAEALQSQGDADFGGVVTADDLVAWRAAFGNSLPALAVVPEPGSLCLAGMVFLGVIRRRRQGTPMREFSGVLQPFQGCGYS
jgi:hypothetical protein